VSSIFVSIPCMKLDMRIFWAKASEVAPAVWSTLPAYHKGIPALSLIPRLAHAFFLHPKPSSLFRMSAWGLYYFVSAFLSITASLIAEHYIRYPLVL
jgi:hypothetical protein